MQRNNQKIKWLWIDRWENEGGSVPFEPIGFRKRAVWAKRPRTVASDGKTRRLAIERHEPAREPRVYLG